MRDYIYIGSAPADAPVAQLGFPDFERLQSVEIAHYLRMLREKFPLPDFRVKREHHEFGSYREVVAYFDDEDEAQVEQAYEAECYFDKWDDQALEAIRAASKHE
jgi:hypothetical protein